LWSSQLQAHDGWCTAKQPYDCVHCGKAIPKGIAFFWVAAMDPRRPDGPHSPISLGSLCRPGPYCHDYHVWKAGKSAGSFQLKEADAWQTAEQPHECGFCAKTIPVGTQYLRVAPIGSNLGGHASKQSHHDTLVSGIYCHEYHAWRTRSLVPQVALEQKYGEALVLLMKKRGAESLGDYLEFGVYKGASMAGMYRTLKKLELDHIRLFGFDSFEGLPETARADDGGNWRPGQFRCGITFTQDLLTRQGVDWDRIRLIKGWFGETLNNELKREFNITKASIIMIDCDMYLSAKQALDFCGPLIQDASIVFFDDWHSGDLASKNLGEKRAFEEFLNDHPDFTIDHLGGYDPNSAVFLVERSES
jgi:hypothetical protein